MKQVEIPRYFNQNEEIYAFADASQAGYGYVIYKGSTILFGKSKVSLQNMTIMDLEHLALLELVKAMKKLDDIMNFKMKINIFTVMAFVC